MDLFHPTDKQKQDIAQWFEVFDSLSKNHRYADMADQAVFPMFVITDDSQGNGVAKVWSREVYIAQMQLAMADAAGELQYETQRTPMMITDHLAVVFTVWRTGEMTLKYVDFLMKHQDQWKFQTMIQGGWGDFLAGQINS